jgi:hypothetical protein
MNPLISSAIAGLVRQGIAGRAQAAVGRVTLPLVCGLVALQFTFVALALLTVAFWNLLLPEIGAVWTPVVLAASFLVLAGIPVCVIMAHRQKRQVNRPPSNDMQNMIEPMLAEARRFTRDNQGTSLVTAIVAGIAAGLATSRD